MRKDSPWISRGKIIDECSWSFCLKLNSSNNYGEIFSIGSGLVEIFSWGEYPHDQMIKHNPTI
jgi:hypothetical protein